MKITKEQGRACLRELEDGVHRVESVEAFAEIGLGEIGPDGTREWFDGELGHYPTALAMCAAIAGVKP